MLFFVDLKSNRFVSIFVLLVFMFCLPACSLRTSGNFSENRVQLVDEKIVQEIPSADLTPAAVQALAEHYEKHGDGPFDLTLTYDPKSKDITAMSVSDRSAELVSALHKAGVSDVRAHILPIKDSEGSTAIISYMGYNALAPKDCELMPGIEGRDINVNANYKLGCSVDTLFARQIARPKDLNGQETEALTDGRRAANQVDVYRAGEPNEALDGVTATGE